MAEKPEPKWRHRTYPMTGEFGKGGRSKRKLLADMLLTGREWSQQELVAGMTAVFPKGSLVYSNRFLAEHIPLLRIMGILEKVGKDKIRVRPELLPLLKERT